MASVTGSAADAWDASSWVTGKIFDVDGGTEAPAITVPPPPFEPSPPS